MTSTFECSKKWGDYRTIFIEGHTDNRPLQGFMGKGNWGLSTFRAISLWQF